MKYNTEQCEIVIKRELAPGIFEFMVRNSFIASGAQPGQFVHILVPGKTLRRPISICDVLPGVGMFRLVIEVRGEGTAVLASTEVGQSFDLLGPLGHGFQLGDPAKPAVFVGGGIGTPPLLFAARHYGINATVLLGFRNKSAVILKDEFKAAGCRIMIATDDGSEGHHGLVTDLLPDYLAGKTSAVYACGPMPMLKTVASAAAQAGVPCQLSLEERMACGVGACLGCAVKVRRPDGSEGYLHVCKDGPVFDAKDVML